MSGWGVWAEDDIAASAHISGLPEDECLTCTEGGIPEGECKKSLRPCGHHCNCSWSQDCCHWCGAELDGDDVVSFPAEAPEMAEATR